MLWDLLPGEGALKESADMGRAAGVHRALECEHRKQMNKAGKGLTIRDTGDDATLQVPQQIRNKKP